MPYVECRKAALPEYPLVAGTDRWRPRQEGDLRPRCFVPPPNLTGRFQAARRTYTRGHQPTVPTGRFVAYPLIDVAAEATGRRQQDTELGTGLQSD
jgi:hypothetical protein